jgi:hypothetical protein
LTPFFTNADIGETLTDLPGEFCQDSPILFGHHVSNPPKQLFSFDLPSFFLRPLNIFRGERQDQRPSACDVRCTDLLAENCFCIFFPALESARERQARLN